MDFQNICIQTRMRSLTLSSGLGKGLTCVLLLATISISISIPSTVARSVDIPGLRRNCILIPGKNSTSRLECSFRKLSVDFTNYTFSPTEIEGTTEGVVKCHPQLYFESFLDPRQILFQFSHLSSLQIEFCKIKKFPSPSSPVWEKLSLLKSLKVSSYSEGSGSGGLSLSLEESGGFDGLARLENLDLSHNNIGSLTIAAATRILCPLSHHLIALNLSYNRISSEFGGFPAHCSGNVQPVPVLRNLDLSHNGLRNLPPNGFIGLENLIELRLENNNIEEIGGENQLGGLRSLKLLNLSANRLDKFPDFSSSPPASLTELYLQSNSIAEADLSAGGMGQLKHLRVLDLSRNRLVSIKSSTDLFPNLLVLKLSFNKLTSVDGLGFPAVQILLLDNNAIQSLHAQTLDSFPSLRTIDLSRNQLRSIGPATFTHSPELRHLSLDHNQIQHIHEEAGLQQCKFLQDVGLAGNQLEEVPLALRSTTLQTMDLGENRIAELSNASFLGLCQLYGLRLVDNKIRSLPPGFCQSLTRLRVLNLAQNLITEIPRTAFAGCPEVRALRLDINKLETAFPEYLTPELPALLWLNLSRNALRRADYRFFPPTVEWLDLSYNALEILGYDGVHRGKSIAINYHLRVLDASHNELKGLNPFSFPAATTEILRVNHNQLRTLGPMPIFSNATHLRRVELMWNKLETFKFPTGASDTEFYLGGNELTCDCSMEWMLGYGVSTRIPDLEMVSCLLPGNRSVPLLQTKSSDFLCPYTSHCFALCHCCEFGACDCAMTCPDQCNCARDSSWAINIVDCSNLAFTDLPPQIPMDATTIHLDGNNFPMLTSHIFIGKKNLRILYLNGSGIQEIKNRTFNGLRSLEILRLNDNLLGRVEGFEFEGLSSLKELYLENNRITHISGDAFTHLKFLEVIHLAGNGLTAFPVWELHANGMLRSISLANNPWSCHCTFVTPFRTWLTSSTNVIADLGGISVKCLNIFTTHGPCGSDTEEEEQNQIFNLIETQNSEFMTPEENRQIVPQTNSAPKENLNALWVSLAGFSAMGIVLVILFVGFRKTECIRRNLGKILKTVRICDTSGHPGLSGREENAKNQSNGSGSDSGEKLFDAYFLYSRSEEEMVKERLSCELERMAHFRLCLHYRDLSSPAAGAPLNSEMIASAASASRVIFVVLSPHLIHSELTNVDFTTALSSTIYRHGNRNLYFILLPPLNSTHGHGYDFLLKNINTNFILDWMDPKFWVRINQLLNTNTIRSSSAARTTRPNPKYQIYAPAAAAVMTSGSSYPEDNLGYHHPYCAGDFGHQHQQQSISLISQSRFCQGQGVIVNPYGGARTYRNCTSNSNNIMPGSSDDELEHLYSTLDSLQGTGYPSR